MTPRGRLLAGVPVVRLARDAAGVVIRALRRLEDDYVAPAGIREVVGHAIDQHALVDRERRLHRAARDPERLDDERLDQQREAERHRHDQHELEQRVQRALSAAALRRRGLRRGAQVACEPASSGLPAPSVSSPSSSPLEAPASPPAASISSSEVSFASASLGTSAAASSPSPPSPPSPP